MIAESFERIDRSNLVQIGILPIEFLAGQGRTDSSSRATIATPSRKSTDTVRVSESWLRPRSAASRRCAALTAARSLTTTWVAGFSPRSCEASSAGRLATSLESGSRLGNDQLPGSLFASGRRRMPAIGPPIPKRCTGFWHTKPDAATLSGTAQAGPARRRSGWRANSATSGRATGARPRSPRQFHIRRLLTRWRPQRILVCPITRWT